MIDCLNFKKWKCSNLFELGGSVFFGGIIMEIVKNNIVMLYILYMLIC